MPSDFWIAIPPKEVQRYKCLRGYRHADGSLLLFKQQRWVFWPSSAPIPGMDSRIRYRVNHRDVAGAFEWASAFLPPPGRDCEEGHM